jgi:hypothetical protein
LMCRGLRCPAALIGQHGAAPHAGEILFSCGTKLEMRFPVSKNGPVLRRCRRVPEIFSGTQGLLDRMAKSRVTAVNVAWWFPGQSMPRSHLCPIELGARIWCDLGETGQWPAPQSSTQPRDGHGTDNRRFSTTSTQDGTVRLSRPAAVRLRAKSSAPQLDAGEPSAAWVPRVGGPWHWAWRR